MRMGAAQEGDLPGPGQFYVGDELAAPMQMALVLSTAVQKWDLPTLRPTAVMMPAKGRCGWLSGTRGYPRSITSSREAMPRRGPSNEDGRRPAPYAIRPWALIASDPVLGEARRRPGAQSTVIRYHVGED